jgi:hypothetical protein
MENDAPKEGQQTRMDGSITSELHKEHRKKTERDPPPVSQEEEEHDEDPLAEKKERPTLTRNSVSASIRTLRPSFSAGVSQKASPTALNSWVSLSQTLDGRDKITKVLQYSARMMAWWCQSRHFRPEYALRFKALQSSLTTSRKAYRIGKSLVEVEKIRKIGALALLKWHLQRALRGTTDSDGDVSPVKAPAWKVLGTALKMLGLLGFWAGDNVSFITSTGFLDDYSLDKTDRLARRKTIASEASMFAARSYFLGCIAGLVTNARSYWTFHQKELKPLQDRIDSMEDETGELLEAKKELGRLKRKQFDLFVPLLKVRMDACSS